MNCLQQYVDLLESISPDNVGQLEYLINENIVFSDPFNQVSGAKLYIALLKDMFDKLNKVSFVVHEQIFQAVGSIECDSSNSNTQINQNRVINNGVAYLYWTFSAASRSTGDISFEGSSRLTFDAHGKILTHQDFWDGLLLLQQFPLLGGLLRQIKKRISYHKE